MTSNTNPRDVANSRVSRKADAAIVAAARPLPALEHRSTADQRQAFLEHLYSDYNELHIQQGEIHERKNQMDFDMFESNQQQIHDILFAKVDTAGGALGDWDTWEKVEMLMKRYAYGRPRHTAQEREEAAAMRSRIEALNEILNERNATIQTLTQTCKATEQELGGVLKLLHMRGNEVKTLSNQHHTATLQLRYIQRECAALRGLRNEDETSLLKKDLSYLIEANKKLEAENQMLRARQQVVERLACASPPQTSLSQGGLSGQQSPKHFSVFVPLQPLQQSTADSDVIDKCLYDDAFRSEFLKKEVPLSRAVVHAKHESASWKRRLEAEVSSAMEMLDFDAATPVQAAPSLISPRPARGVWQSSLPQLDNGVFISYASYENAPLMRAEQSTIPMLVAPTTAVASVPFSSSSAAPVGAAKVGAATNATAATATATAPTAATFTTATAKAAATTATTTTAAAKTKMAAATAKTAAVTARDAAATAKTAGAITTTAEAVRPAVAATARVAAAAKAAVGAPSLAAGKKMPSVDASTTAGARASLPSEARKTQHQSTTSNTHMRGGTLGSPAAGVAAAPGTTAKNAAQHEMQTQEHITDSETGRNPAFALLQSSILQCTELSRANAMRRELLHVAHLRQMLADKMARAASHVTAETARVSTPQQSALSYTEQQLPQQGQYSAMDSSVASPPVSDWLEDEHTTVQRPATSSPQQLRQMVYDNRSPLHAAIGGEMRESDGGEVQCSVMLHAPDGYGATRTNSQVPSTCTPTPSPLSRLQSNGSEVRCRGRVTDAGVVGAVARPPGQRALPLRQRAAILQQEVASLRRSVVTYSRELQDALAILGMLFEEREANVTQVMQEQVKDEAMEDAAERVLEEAALQRTAHICKKRFGTVLPADIFTPTRLPETATDEEWLVHELHSVAAAMIKESVHQSAPSSIPDADGVVEGDDPRGQLQHPLTSESPSSLLSRQPAPQHQHQHYLSPAARDYFESEILQPFRLQPNLPRGGAPHTKFTTLNGAGWWDNDGEEDDEGASDVAGGIRGANLGGRAVGGVDGRSRMRPAPPTQWHWRTRDTHDAGTPSQGPAAVVRRPVVPTRQYVTFTAPLLTTAASVSQSSPASVQSIRPTVLRYDFGGARAARQRLVTENIQKRTAFLYGSQFEDFVRRYIVPIISTATGVSTGGEMSTAMRAAVQDLRKKERMCRKRGVRLLFNRVANNIRTRTLLRRKVYQGEAFVSYVGLLYRNWRTALERERRQLQLAKRSNCNALFTLLQLPTSSSAAETLTKPAPPSALPLGKPKPSASGFKRVMYGALDKSSFHFDEAKFNTES
ncbi:hypothetical protein ABL78_1632 [Leptomonas seymouri]|uniref:Uncharacterized protein n=1 Tax=Leptomonas seymouri TaxID=5684 RepID=A0A0N0P7X5_LEPSE|nr:hypothetical protein ABL78_1632 [Leptomonas seymouri]|eukprot:KPI89299.1 hypothetical protein ABL78_1632 [Leptomonas seymouri]